ncbi:hypothetical protein L7F22_069371 [Adiantum nelumboides]|nr:hypothetical protein [Adiantum nelumboides]
MVANKEVPPPLTDLGVPTLIRFVSDTHPIPLLLVASFQDEGANENTQTPLGKEKSSNQAEGMKDDGAPLEEGLKVEVKFVLEKKCLFG